MNLKNYFQEQKNSHMSDTDKLNLYQNFMLKNMERHYARKRSFLHVKSFAYSIIIMFFLFSLYWVYFFTDKYTEYEGLIMNSSNSVQASYIAKVVDFNGSFYIEHKGKRVQTSTIQDGDIITLKENTQLITQINAWTKAKLIWPAQFSIEQISKGNTPQYKLNIIQGDFIEMRSMQAKPSEKIQLTMEDTITVQEANGKAIDYQLIKSWEQHIVKNSGDAISVTTTDQNNKQTKTNLNSTQVLAIGNNDIRLFDNMKKFADAMKTNNVSQIFTLNSSQETISDSTAQTWTDDESGLQPLQEVSLTSLLNTADQVVDQEVSSDLWSLFSDSKQIVSEAQYKAIPSADYIKLLIDDISNNRLKGQEKELSIAYNNVERTIAKLYEVFGLSYAKPSWTTIQENLLSLKASTTSIISSIKNWYTLPEKYFSDLTTFANKLGELAGQEFWWTMESTDKN